MHSMTHSASASHKPTIYLDSPSSATSPSSSLTSPSSFSLPLTPRPILLNSDEQLIDDVSLHFLYQPHTILSFFLVLALLLYFAFHPSASPSSLATNVKLAVFVCSLFLLLLGLLVFPSGPFVRPHPLLWRLSFGLGVLYELSLIMLLFQTKSDARQALTWLYPELGRPLEERTYAAHCELTVENVRGALDLFAFAHLVGWMVKAIILRDAVVCWLISVQWELIEKVFKHALPNFAECWWDSWLLDVVICNGLGIYLGQRICERLEMRSYQWTKLQDIPTLLGKAKRAALQFTPQSWTVVRWESTKTIGRFLTVNVVVCALNLAELNAFMLKALLWIPPPNALNFYRLLIWAFLGPPAIRQVYIYMAVPRVKSIGLFTFLSCCILATEVLLIVKLSRDEFQEPMPHNVRVGLGVGLIAYACVVAAVCLRIGRRSVRTPTAEAAGRQKAA